MARKKIVEEEVIEENISVEPLEEVMGDRYATYAKYVIQDRAIPDVRDGLKPVQRRIIFSMFKSNNTFNKPTRKCAHTVGAVMGTFHPHGDTSIYDALARMSQDWKLRYPLIDFQGNNGSIDGDSPAAYRYTESRLAELSNELIRDIDKKTVDMQLNFDDTELEPVVLPARFPNLLVNGTEGIAVALATEIPPHNLREVIDAVIYRINHKYVTSEDLLEYVKGPDFPGGGIIYDSEGLRNIYLSGRGKIEVAAKTEIVSNKDNKQIIITEIPYKVVKSQLVYEIDKIIHSKSVSGMNEIRDESDWKGIRIVIDCKKDAKVELLLKYLMKKTPLLTSYSANMVAIVNGRPKTLTLLDFVDAYIAHQVEVVTRCSQFDLKKYSDRLHIVEGLIKASLLINEVVDIIKKSKDKADSKINIMNHFGFSNEQAEAIVTMPLYKLSHTDEAILEKEKEELIKNIEFLNEILSDEDKLNRVIIKDLKAIANKYGDDRRTQIEEKGETIQIDKRELIAKEDTIVTVSRDGYIKRSSLKSYRSNENTLPGLKDGDALVTMGQCFTTDYLICFTNYGNYACIPVHVLTENKWKDEGVHINTFVTLGPGEKIIKAIAVNAFRNDVRIAILTKFGQIKRMAISSLDSSKKSKPAKFMKLLAQDEIVGIQLVDGRSDLLVITNNGNASYYPETEVSVVGAKAGGVKSIANIGKNSAVALLAFKQDEKSKFALLTDLCHYRVLDNNRFVRTNRLGKVQHILPCFKNETHHIVSALKINTREDLIKLNLYLNDNSIYEFNMEDTHLWEMDKYAKKNIDSPKGVFLNYAFDTTLEIVDNKTPSYVEKVELEAENSENMASSDDETAVDASLELNEVETEPIEERIEQTELLDLPEEPKVEEPKVQNHEEKKKDKDMSFEQISIFDDLD